MSIESVMPSNHLILYCHFSSCPQSFPAWGPFLMSQLFTSGGQSIGASASVLPMNTQDWFPLGWTGCISLQSKGLSRVFSNITVQKHQFFGGHLSLSTLTSIHDYGKNHSFDWMDLCQQIMSLLFNMLSRLVTAFLPRSKHLLISWLQSPSAVILEPKKIKSVTVFVSSPIYLPWRTSLVAQMLKRLAYNAGDLGLVTGSGKSSGEGKGNPLQYSCLENPMDRGAWWTTVHGVAKSQTWLSDVIFKHLPWSDGTRCFDLSFLNVEF